MMYFTKECEITKQMKYNIRSCKHQELSTSGAINSSASFHIGHDSLKVKIVNKS